MRRASSGARATSRRSSTRATPGPCARRARLSSPRKRTIRSAISSPFSSCRKCPAPATISAGPAPGMRDAMCSAATVEKIGSESEKRTSAGRSQCSSAARTSSIFAALGCSSSVGTSSGNASTPAFDSGVGKGALYASTTSSASSVTRGDPDELAGDEVGADAADELAEAQPLLRGRAAGADPGVQDHEPRDAIRPLDGEPEPDRPAPVLDDDGRLAQVELVGEALDRCVVEVVGVVLDPRRLVRAAEAEVVGRDDAGGVGDRRDQLAVEERPRRLAVEQEHRDRPRPRRRSASAARPARRSAARTS